MSDRCAFIFANGELKDPAAVRAMIHAEDLLIAADNGLAHLRSMGLSPHLLVGDLDSIGADDLEAVQSAGVPIERHPPEKNETDLELALDRALAAGCRKIRIVAALGGRLDMTLSSVLLLTRPEFRQLDIRLDDGCDEVLVIWDEVRLRGRAGDRVSLLALDGPAEGVETEDLYYPLAGETLYPDRTRGISNVMLGDSARVRLLSGTLICVHTRQQSTSEDRED